MRASRQASLFAFVLLAAACAQPAPPPAPAAPKADLAADAQAIRALDAAWMKAAQARDAAGETVALATDAMIVRQSAPAMNVAEFKAYDEKFYKENPKVDSSWTTDTLDVNDSGDWAVQTGTYTLTGLGPKGDGKDVGKFVTRWKKISGAWRVVHDTSVSTTPVPTKK